MKYATYAYFMRMIYAVKTGEIVNPVMNVLNG